MLLRTSFAFKMSVVFKYNRVFICFPTRFSAFLRVFLEERNAFFSFFFKKRKTIKKKSTNKSVVVGGEVSAPLNE